MTVRARPPWRPGFVVGLGLFVTGLWWLAVQLPKWQDAGSTWLPWLTIAVGLVLVFRAPPRMAAGPPGG